jgi:hypothetical protein
MWAFGHGWPLPYIRTEEEGCSTLSDVALYADYLAQRVPRRPDRAALPSRR